MRIIRLYICTSIFLSSIIGQVFGPEPFLNKNWINVKDQTETRCDNTLDGKSHPAKLCRSKQERIAVFNFSIIWKRDRIVMLVNTKDSGFPHFSQ